MCTPRGFLEVYNTNTSYYDAFFVGYLLLYNNNTQ